MLLGTFLEKAINIVTIGQGKNLARAVAAYRGKSKCGCDKRKKKINEWHARKFKNLVQKLIEEIEDELGAVFETRKSNVLEQEIKIVKSKKFVETGYIRRNGDGG
jgi:ribosomal protein S17E